MSQRKPKKIFDFSFFVLFALIFFNIFLFKKYYQLENQRNLSNFPGGQQKKEELEQNIENTKNEIENLNQQTDAIIRDTAMFKEKQPISKEEIRQLILKNADLKKLKDSQEKEVVEIQKQIKALEEEIKKIEISISAPYIAEKQKEIDNLNQQITNLNNEVQRLKQINTDKQIEINNLNQQITNLNNQIQQLTQQKQIERMKSKKTTK